VEKKLPNGSIIRLDNRWVVPYNPLLSTLFDCHINIEIVHSVSCIKYLCKYCYKGHDAMMAKVAQTNANGEVIVKGVDEISQYLDAR
jgi:hypothetical protein